MRHPRGKLWQDVRRSSNTNHVRLADILQTLDIGLSCLGGVFGSSFAFLVEMNGFQHAAMPNLHASKLKFEHERSKAHSRSIDDELGFDNDATTVGKIDDNAVDDFA